MEPVERLLDSQWQPGHVVAGILRLLCLHLGFEIIQISQPGDLWFQVVDLLKDLRKLSRGSPISKNCNKSVLSQLTAG